VSDALAVRYNLGRIYNANRSRSRGPTPHG
jgi:hypothetical protein